MTPDEIREHLLEVARSGVEFRMLDKYVVVQISARTWDAITAWEAQTRDIQENPADYGDIS